ncbi:MAG: hypothetical protein LBU67_10980, partial [Oscillospiraceae bacterium]|nr:hypothetical protein [Oscillospiraceae bacterium]
MEENQVYAAEAPQNETQAQAAAVPQSDPAVQNAPNDNTAQGAPETQPNPNQQTIDRAMGQRLYAARQKWEREHRPVQDFARRMRAFFPGMDEA